MLLRFWPPTQLNDLGVTGPWGGAQPEGMSQQPLPRQWLGVRACFLGEVLVHTVVFKLELRVQICRGGTKLRRGVVRSLAGLLSGEDIRPAYRFPQMLRRQQPQLGSVT
jgi:hypothetical protein